MEIFTNREIAVLIWVAIFTIHASFNKQIRASILSLVKSILKVKILIIFVLYLGYFSAITYSFYYLKWWDISNLKDTITWFIFSGFPIGGFVATNKLARGFWKDLILKNLKLILIVEFLINLFTFSLIVELFIVPAITLTVMLNTLSGQKKEYKAAEKFTRNIMSFFGIFILLYSFYKTINGIQSIEIMSTLKSFLLPVAYSIISIPYMYIFKLYVEYENLFIRLKFGRKRSKELNLWIKLRLLLFCNFQIKKLQIAANMNNYNLMSISSKDEIDVAIRSYKNELSTKSDKSETTKTTYITLKTPQKLVSTNTSSSEMPLQFSDSKKEELIGYMTEQYGAKEVKVTYISSSKPSSTGLLAVDYYIDTTPIKTDLNNNIANIVILSESLAEESGIPNSNISVCAMTMDGTQLGIGNYYSSTGKANINVNACP